MFLLAAVYANFLSGPSITQFVRNTNSYFRAMSENNPEMFSASFARSYVHAFDGMCRSNRQYHQHNIPSHISEISVCCLPFCRLNANGNIVICFSRLRCHPRREMFFSRFANLSNTADFLKNISFLSRGKS